ncbi:MAG: YggS family pyridoxal phosphate-dependent enzyme [Chloroflexota bacterium]
MVNTISERLSEIHNRITQAAQRVNRDASEIRMVGVSKMHSPDLIREAYAAGLTDFGESRVQEAEPKIDALREEHSDIVWHLIGALQTNKAKRAVRLFDMVHSLDRLSLAHALNRHLAEAIEPEQTQAIPPHLDVLLQVNVSGEASKYGFPLFGWEDNQELVQQFFGEVEQMISLPHLVIRGLMTIAPWADDPETARPTFQSTRQLRDVLAQQFPTQDWSELSMGMTDDFPIAIEEGATLVRVGRALFGERPV